MLEVDLREVVYDRKLWLGRSATYGLEPVIAAVRRAPEGGACRLLIGDARWVSVGAALRVAALVSRFRTVEVVGSDAYGVETILWALNNRAEREAATS